MSVSVNWDWLQGLAVGDQVVRNEITAFGVRQSVHKVTRCWPTCVEVYGRKYRRLDGQERGAEKWGPIREIVPPTEAVMRGIELRRRRAQLSSLDWDCVPDALVNSTWEAWQSATEPKP